MAVPFDELSFFNQQLAAMLREGLPLEGALRDICQHMGRTELKLELQKLEGDLANGTPLAEALPRRRLPEFYVQTLLAGVRGNDLPGVLTLLADYYGQTHSIRTRLKGLMFYPILVLAVSLLLTLWLAFLQHPLSTPFIDTLSSRPPVNQSGVAPLAPIVSLNQSLKSAGFEGPRTTYIWMPPVTVLMLTLISACLAGMPRTRRSLRWRLPAFKEASLAQLAAGLHLLLKSGSTLDEALSFLLPVEQGTPAEMELEQWRERLAQGHGKLAALAQESTLFPPLFLWLASSGGNDLAAGFARAAEVYRERASYRIELLLNAALPASMVVLGIMLLLQIYPLAIQAFRNINQVFRLGL